MKKIFWIATSFLLVLFAVEDWAFYRPGARRLAQLNVAIDESRDRVIGSQFPADKRQKIKELIEQNSIHGGASSDGEDYASQSLQKLTVLLRELEIELLSITPEEVWEEELFEVYPFEMELRCGYHQFGRLLKAIERSEGLIGIQAFQLTPLDSGGAVISLAVEIYLFKMDEEERMEKNE